MLDGQIQLLAAFTVGLLAVLRYFRGATRPPPPPGPPGRPLLGLNPKHLPRTEPWKVYADWGKKYGPISSFHVLGRRVIILNSFEAASELLNKRTSIYSERPSRVFYDVVMARGTAVFNIPASDERHKTYRKLLHGTLNVRAIHAYQSMQEEECKAFLKRLAVSPDAFADHVRRNAISLIMRITYGYAMQENDPLVAVMEESIRIMNFGAVPGRWLVDAVPLLLYVPSWFPGAGWKRLGEQWREQIDALFWKPFAWTKDRVAHGTAEPSFTSSHLQESTHIPESTLVKCASALYIGGADTSAGALITFFLLMSLHPDVQTRAQVEIDSITGGQRLPTCNDLDHFPYLRQVMQEVLRWCPVAPLAIPHAPLRDDEYGGYLLEKGAVVYANLWGMFHDPAVYPDPDMFEPDRFKPESTGVSPQPDPMEWVFGFGRRICPGLHFAQMSLMLNMASLLSVFNITKARDEAGAEIEPNFKFTTGITSHPESFGCSIVPRSATALSFLA